MRAIRQDWERLAAGQVDEQLYMEDPAYHAIVIQMRAHEVDPLSRYVQEEVLKQPFNDLLDQGLTEERHPMAVGYVPRKRY